MITLQELGSVGELVSGLAVLVTLFYLAVQVRHIRNESQRNALIESNRMYNDIFLASMTSTDLALVLEKAGSDYESLKPYERIMLDQYLGAVINATEISYDLIAHGNFETGFASSMDSLLQHFFAIPGAAQHWDTHNASYTAPFRQAVNEYLGKSP